MISPEKIRKIISVFSEDYKKKFITPQENRKEEMLKNWRVALDFLFDKIFSGGRPEKTSEKFGKKTKYILDKFFAGNNYRFDENSRVVLKRKLEDGGVNNERDRKMVLDVLEFLNKIDGHNIVLYSKHLIEEGKISDIFEQLTTLYNVKEKKAALFLRDLVDILGLEKRLRREEFKYVLPIDTWVNKVSKMFGVLNKGEDEGPEWRKDSEAIGEFCEKNSISPIKFDQACWYIGFYSFDILLELLKNQISSLE